MGDLGKKGFMVLLLIGIFFLSCKDRIHERLVMEQKRINDSINSTIEGKLRKIPVGKFETFDYEGCEYLLYKEEGEYNSAYGFMAHKGNCSNPIHVYSEYR